MGLFNRNKKGAPPVIELVDVNEPIPHLPKVDVKNPASFGDDYNLVMLVGSLTGNKLRVLKSRQTKLLSELAAVETELKQAEAFDVVLRQLKENKNG